EIDRRNAAFWDELCGTGLATQLGITEPSPENLARFDSAYMELYPYLEAYLPKPQGEGERLLEIGLGYGTVSQILAERGFDYHANPAGEAAPGTGYTSRAEARRLFSGFSEVRIRSENFDPLELPRLTIDRWRLLGWPAHLAGLDLYITATK